MHQNRNQNQNQNHNHNQNQIHPLLLTERIEDMRRAIGAGAGSYSSDELRLIDLLGEGGFGKVYRGEPLASDIRGWLFRRWGSC